MGAILSHIGLPTIGRNTNTAGNPPATSRGLVEVGRNFGQVIRQLQITDPKIDVQKISDQVLSLLQSGMPLQTIVNQIATTLAGKVATAIAHATKHAIDDVSKNKLLQAFASALAPPGGSPPGSSAEQAQTLAEQLQQLVANLAGDAAANAGQQNRFAGQVLDATTAREIPAHEQDDQTESPDSASISSFVESVLADALAALQTSTGVKTTPTVARNVTDGTPSIPLPVIVYEPATLHGATRQLETGSQVQPQPQTQSKAQSLLQPAPQGQSQDGDVLGRIIARAATASARFANVPVATANPILLAAQSKPAAPSDSAAASAQPVAVRASLQNLVTAIVDSANNQNGNASGNSKGNAGAFNWSLGSSALAQLSNAKLMPQSSDTTSFAAQANALLGSSFTPSNGGGAIAMPLAPYTTVDANSVIDQMIKGLQVKNFGSENSEVRMRLSPENLGDVSVRLTTSGGNISASITAQNADVRDSLLANQHQLAKSLADAGLKLQNFSVNVSGGGAHGFAQHQELARHAGSRRGAFQIGQTDEAQSDVLSATPTFGPPLAAIQTLGLLNYLA